MKLFSFSSEGFSTRRLPRPDTALKDHAAALICAQHCPKFVKVTAGPENFGVVATFIAGVWWVADIYLGEFTRVFKSSLLPLYG
jgi:hypothetical protein